MCIRDRFGDIVSIGINFPFRTFKSLNLFVGDLDLIMLIYFKNFPSPDAKWIGNRAINYVFAGFYTGHNYLVPGVKFFLKYRFKQKGIIKLFSDESLIRDVLFIPEQSHILSL